MCGDGALVADTADSAGNHCAAGVDEIVHVDIARRGNQRTHIHHGTLSEHHPVGVHQHHRAVGRQAAEYLRRIGIPRHAVEHCRRRIGLHEQHRLAGIDIE